MKAKPDQVINKCIPLAALRPHPRNYNRHDEAQIGDLRLSLRTFGQVRSIVVQAQARSKNFLTVAGHGLVEAARLESFEELRADVIPAGWDDTRVLAYLAADNELARRGTPDEAQLARLVEDVERESGAGLAALAAGSEERLKELRDAIKHGSINIFPDDGSGPPNMELLPDEKYDYVLLTFREQSEFDKACLALGLENRRDPRTGWAQHIGLCRVVEGPAIIRRLNGNRRSKQAKSE